jgi:hypothetical protein
MQTPAITANVSRSARNRLNKLFLGDAEGKDSRVDGFGPAAEAVEEHCGPC